MNRKKDRPRTRPPEERRDELMNAAQKIFLKKGVSTTTIEQITETAGVAKGTFYLYFSSKEEILTALGDRFAAKLLESTKEAIAKKREEDWIGKLEAWAETCACGYLDTIQLHDVLFYGWRNPTREEIVDNVSIDHLTDLLTAGMTAGAWTIEDSRFTSVFLFSGLTSVVDDVYIKEKLPNRNRLVRRLQRLCFRAVGRLD